MSAADSPKPSKVRRACPERCRRDGWTAERQLRFLDTLARTRSVTAAARAAGMSRESAYRLRKRKDGALFAAAWDRALEDHNPTNAASRRLGTPARISRANPPKVTKSMKYTNPRFDAWRNLLRDFRTAG
jgi:hypothetical protein